MVKRYLYRGKIQWGKVRKKICEKYFPRRKFPATTNFPNKYFPKRNFFHGDYFPDENASTPAYTHNPLFYDVLEWKYSKISFEEFHLIEKVIQMHKMEVLLFIFFQGDHPLYSKSSL